MVARLTAEADQAPGHVEKKGVIDQLTVSLPILWRSVIAYQCYHKNFVHPSCHNELG